MTGAGRYLEILHLIDKERLTSHSHLYLAITVGVAYGLFARAVFGDWISDVAFPVMSVTFLFGVPFGLGVLTVAIAGRERPIGWA